MDKSVIILLGAPGSGKGTQAAHLAKELGIAHISTGELMRDEIRRKTPIGLKIQSFVESGKYATDEMLFEVLFNRINREDCQKGYILDGVPRTIHQAEVLEEKYQSGVRLIVANLDVKEQTIIDRAASRLLCRDCGAVYNKVSAPSKQEGVCDNCGGELYHRKDDQPEVVQERLKVYKDQTQPLINFYESRGLLHHIDGELPVDEVYAKLSKLI